MSCVGRLCKDYLYLYNSLPLIPTPPLIMAVNIGEAVGCPLPSKPPWAGALQCGTASCSVFTAKVTRLNLSPAFTPTPATSIIFSPERRCWTRSCVTCHQWKLSRSFVASSTQNAGQGRMHWSDHRLGWVSAAPPAPGSRKWRGVWHKIINYHIHDLNYHDSSTTIQIAPNVQLQRSINSEEMATKRFISIA